MAVLGIVCGLGLLPEVTFAAVVVGAAAAPNKSDLGTCGNH